MLSVVIVDDEAGALETLRVMLRKPALGTNLVGTAASALEGIKLIQRTRPDLVLLDIEMPHGSGFDLIDAFPERRFKVIYTTAHEQHAVRAAHTHPFDYLLKPVDPDDLERAIGQLREQHTRPERIEVASTTGRVFLLARDIRRIEADGGYCTIHTAQRERHVASRNLGHFEELLSATVFFRCHHSHLVNLTHVRGFTHSDGGAIVLDDGTIVPLASRRRADFDERMKSLE